MTIRRCPVCRSLAVRRSRRRGFLERLILPLVFRRPYRCQDCEQRHYDSVFSRMAPQASRRSPALASATK